MDTTQQHIAFDIVKARAAVDAAHDVWRAAGLGSFGHWSWHNVHDAIRLLESLIGYYDVLEKSRSFYIVRIL